MKTAIELIKMYSPRPESGYGSSWIIGAMEAYKDQEVATERQKIKDVVYEMYLNSGDTGLLKVIALIDNS